MPRTGTTSIKAGLEILGLGPGYHPSVILHDHLDHCKFWINAANRSTTSDDSVDFGAIFRGYGHASGTPVLYFYEEFLRRFPRVKFILTRRDPEEWYASVSRTISHQLRQLERETTAADPAADANSSSREFLGMLKAVRGNALERRDTAVRHMREHEERVRRTIPRDRLLVYEVVQGWEPLCEFLGKPVPDQAFPRTNDAVQFMTTYRVTDAIE